jgi:hypothetical protein
MISEKIIMIILIFFDLWLKEYSRSLQGSKIEASRRCYKAGKAYNETKKIFKIRGNRRRRKKHCKFIKRSKKRREEEIHKRILFV